MTEDLTRSTLEMVAEFHIAFGHPINSKPNLRDKKLNILRIQLLMEEYAELIHAIGKNDHVEALDALTDLQYVLDGAYLAWGIAKEGFDLYGFSAKIDPLGVDVSVDNTKFLRIVAVLGRRLANLTDVILRGYGSPEDLADDMYEALRYTQQALYACYNASNLGYLAMPAFIEVQRANMSKLDADGKPILDAAGRVVKSEMYTPPDIAGVIDRHG